MLWVCFPTTFHIYSSLINKGKAKGEATDSGVFLILLGVDLTVTCHFTGSFVSYFRLLVLPGKSCEQTEPGSNFHLSNDFLI